MELPLETSTNPLRSIDFETLATTLKALAHPTRLAIIGLLVEHPRLHCTQLIEQLGIEQTLLSHHLSHLFDRGILRRVKEGKFILYSLADQRMARIMECMIHPPAPRA